MTDLEQQITDHLHRRAAAVTPRYDLEAVEQGIGSVEFVHRDDRPNRRPLIGLLLGAAAAAAVVGVTVVVMRTPDDNSTTVIGPTVGTSPTGTVAEVPPTSVFLGSWTSTDADETTPIMTIAAAANGAVEMTVQDNVSSVCSGAASTMTGTGLLDSNGDLVVAAPVLTCDDGSEPEALSGPPLDEQLRNLTFTHDPGRDILSDNTGVVWSREGADDPSAAPPTSGAMWPQSSVDEVRQAQELADAGDPAYTWQVDPQLTSPEWWAHLRDPGTEIVERFLREELGWDTFLFNPYEGDDGDGAADGVLRGVVYLRCAVGETNPLYPTAPDGHQEAPGAERCAPTIDDFRYETVSLDLSQPDQRGRDGIWVVSRWGITAPFVQADPGGVEADATGHLEDFLRARIAGAGAEGYVEVTAHTRLLALEEVPLLYATSTGAPYERYEIERVSGPQWPYGEMEFNVRLYADGGQTVVEQPIRLTFNRYSHDAPDTTENGKPVRTPHVFFDGEVTASATPPWEVSWRFAVALTMGDQAEERVELVADPHPVATGCEQGPAPADAEALARSMQSDPDLVVTAPVDVRIGDVEGLVMDITVAPGASVCEEMESPQVVTQGDDAVHVGPGPPGLNLDQGSRMRLYLLDHPEGSATRILAIAIVAPEARFEVVSEAAAPIIESIEFHQGGS